MDGTGAIKSLTSKHDGESPTLLVTIRERTMRFAGHCYNTQERERVSVSIGLESHTPHRLGKEEIKTAMQKYRMAIVNRGTHGQTVICLYCLVMHFIPVWRSCDEICRRNFVNILSKEAMGARCIYCRTCRWKHVPS